MSETVAKHGHVSEFKPSGYFSWYCNLNTEITPPPKVFARYDPLFVWFAKDTSEKDALETTGCFPHFQ